MLKTNTNRDQMVFLKSLVSPLSWCRGDLNYLPPVTQPAGLLCPSPSSPSGNQPLGSRGLACLILVLPGIVASLSSLPGSSWGGWGGQRCPTTAGPPWLSSFIPAMKKHLASSPCPGGLSHSYSWAVALLSFLSGLLGLSLTALLCS